jgi:hypothetical protein
MAPNSADRTYLGRSVNQVNQIVVEALVFTFARVQGTPEPRNNVAPVPGCPHGHQTSVFDSDPTSVEESAAAEQQHHEDDDD